MDKMYELYANIILILFFIIYSVLFCYSSDLAVEFVQE